MIEAAITEIDEAMASLEETLDDANAVMLDFDRTIIEKVHESLDRCKGVLELLEVKE